MLPSEIRDAILTRAAALTLGSKAGPGDRFTALRVAKEPDEAAERTLMAKLISSGRDATSTCARFAVYQVVAFYHPSPDIDDRMADDNLTLDDSMWSLHEADADISEVSVSDSTIGEDFRTRRDVRVVYLHG